LALLYINKIIGIIQTQNRYEDKLDEMLRLKKEME